MLYEVIVIGGGPGGYLTAERAGQAGKKVLLIEKKALGGTCLNEGCIPTKTLINSAKFLEHSSGVGTMYGVTCNDAVLDHSFVIDRKDRVVKQLVAGVAMQLRHNKVVVKYGTAVITGKKGDIFEVCVDNEQFTAPNIIVATGSNSLVPAIPGVKDGLASGFVETSREILNNKTVPKSIVVAGGGVIGLEMAYYFNCIGVQVTIVEMMNQIGGTLDKDLANRLCKIYRNNGIKIITGAKVIKIMDNALVYESNGEQESISCDRVLMSLGRRPNTEGLGLETVGAALGSKRELVCDEHCQTNISGLYAVGDVNGKIMLAHTAYREAECVVNNICGVFDTMDYAFIPAVIYSHPEVAYAGYTEETADELGINAQVVQLPMQYSGRYVAENEAGTGICKLLFNMDSNTLIGAHILSDYASEIILFCSSMMSLGIKTDQMKQLVFPHPTVGEIIREAVWSVKS